jgi:hypothetical protein
MNREAKSWLDSFVGRIQNNQAISKLITGIFYSIPPNQPYPYIHLNNISIKDYPIKCSFAKEVSFETSIYSKANDHVKLSIISDLIYQILSSLEIDIISCKMSLIAKGNISENKIINRMIIFGEKI